MSVFWRNAAGFFVQVLPCMLMVFLPFPEEAFRFRRRYVLIGITAAAAVLAALFPAAMYGAAGWNVAVAANLYMFAAISLTLAAQHWLVRESLRKKTLVFFLVLFYGVSQYWLVNMLNAALPELLPLPLERESWAVYSPCGLAMYAVTTAVLLPVMAVFVIRPLREYLQEIEMRKMRQEVFILAASTVIFLVLVIAVDIRYYRLGYRLYLQEMPLFLAVQVDQMAIYWLIFRESVRRKRDNEHQRALEIQQLQYEKIMGDMESTRRMRHDLHHHFNALSGMLERGDVEGAKKYLAKVVEASAERMNEVYCGDLAVNGLLQYYVGLARDEGIRCDIQADCGELAIEPVDLTVLLGNALENAINACRKFPGDRWISVRVGTVQGSLAMEISNSCKSARMDRRFQSGDGFSPAEAFLRDRAGAGCGLRSISHTAQKYGGSAKFRFNAEKETFTARIRLNMHMDI